MITNITSPTCPFLADSQLNANMVAPILITDCNDATDNQRVYIIRGSEGSNLPVSGEYGYIRVFNDLSGNITQIFTSRSYRASRIWIRGRDNTKPSAEAWGAWIELAKQADVDQLNTELSY